MNSSFTTSQLSSLSNDCICGFEALVRWNHPERGLIYPGEFIPVAEESDLIILLDCWVLREACRQMAEWHRSFPSVSPLTINVNVAARHLCHLRLVEEVELALAESHLNPGGSVAGGDRKLSDREC